LANVVQPALILNGGGEIGPRDLHFEAPRAAPQSSSQPLAWSPPDMAGDPAGNAMEAETTLGVDLREKERELIIDALRRGHGSKQEAAKLLGISPRTLRYKLQKLREAGMAVAE